MLACQIDFLKYQKEFFAYSGRGMFHRGHYEDCLDHPAMKYSLIELGMGSRDLQTYVGLCLPKACSDERNTAFIDSALKMLGMPYSVFSINSHIEDYNYPMPWVGYLTIFMLTAIVILVVAATVRNYRCDKREQKSLLACFDILANAKQHFKIRQNEDLNVWDGVRSIAMMWVVIGHSYSTLLGAGAENIVNIKQISSKPFLLIVEAGLISVDIFFTLGGFFLAFVMLRNKITLKICGLGILQRALRIWPAYILAMMFYYSLFMGTGSGIMWSRGESGPVMCNTMWKVVQCTNYSQLLVSMIIFSLIQKIYYYFVNQRSMLLRHRHILDTKGTLSEILFVSNFVKNGEEACLGWGWYLQVDFQLFIVGIFLLYLYSKRKVLCLVVSLLFAVGSTVFIFVYTYRYDIRIITDIINNPNLQTFMLDVYTKPYGRCVPYLMGLILGIIFMQYRNDINYPQNRRLLGRFKNYLLGHNKMRILIEWIGIALMAFVAFIPRTIQVDIAWSQTVHSLYQSFSKPIFIFGMFMTVLPSSLGVKHSFFNLILNAKIFAFIARISFCTYLVHIFVMTHVYYTRNYDFYFNLIDIFNLFLGILCLSLFFGFILTMTVQIPFSLLLKKAMPNHQRSSQTQNVVKSDSIMTIDSVAE